MFAKVRIGSLGNDRQLAIPERAVGTDQDRKFIYVVNDKNIIEYREVELGDSFSGQRIILNGLTEGDLVVTDGIIRLRPDMPVSPQIQEERASASSVMRKVNSSDASMQEDLENLKNDSSGENGENAAHDNISE